MRAIWKFRLDKDGEVNAFEVPAGAKVVFVQVQHDTPTIWMEVQPKLVTELRRFVAVGTGKEFGDDGDHIGSVMHGPFVWHLYEVKPIPKSKEPKS